MHRWDLLRNRAPESHSLTALLATSLLLWALGGCGGERGFPFAGGLKLTDCYPFAGGALWQYQWESSRGDRWRGSMTVIEARREHGTAKFVAVDTTSRSGAIEVSRSAYTWDREGLKHLYRKCIGGDSTTFAPPRLVVPARLEKNRAISSNYRYQIYTPEGKIRNSGEVFQEHRLVDRPSLKTPFGSWNRCVLVEVVRDDRFRDGSSRTRKMLLWLARGTGPVKIVTGIPPESAGYEGEECGLLIHHR